MASALASRAMEEPLPPWQRARLRLHLAMCRDCTNFTRQIAFLRKASRRLPQALEGEDR